MSMKAYAQHAAWLFLCSGALAGCGVQVATTAATSAAIKKQEVEAAQQSKAMAQKQIDQAAQAMQQRSEQLDKAHK